MEKEFIPYEQALALKELGFDEPCAACYGSYTHKTSELFLNINNPVNIKILVREKTGFNRPTFYVKTPTFSQVFRWFRENYDLHGITFKNRKNMLYNEGIKTHSYTIMGSYNDILYNTLSNEYKLSFEEAELECLKELIEIVKN